MRKRGLATKKAWLFALFGFLVLTIFVGGGLLIALFQYGSNSQSNYTTRYLEDIQPVRVMDTWDGSASAVPSGSGTSDNPYIIASAANLNYVRQYASSYANGKYLKQTVDINLNDSTAWQWTTSISSFYYDGTGHTISGCYPNGSYYFFGNGTMTAGYLKNITFQGSWNISSSSMYYDYPIFNVIQNFTFENVTTNMNCTRNYSSDNDSATGAFACYGYGTFRRCANIGNRRHVDSGGGGDGSRCCGFMQYNSGNTTFEYCYNSGTITGNGTSSYGKVGGFLSYYSSGTLTFNNCYNIGTIAGGYSGCFGAFVGSGFSGSFSTCYYYTSACSYIYGGTSSVSGVTACSSAAAMQSSTNGTAPSGMSGLSSSNWIFKASSYPQPKWASVTKPTTITYTYDGTSKTAPEYDKTYITASGNYTDQTNVGSYSATYTLNNTTNFVWSDSTYNSSAITLTWEILPNDSEIVYHFNNNRYFYAGEYENTGVYLDYSKSFSIDIDINIPSSGLRYLVVGNYDGTGNALNIEISATRKLGVYLNTGGANDIYSEDSIIVNEDVHIHFDWNGSSGDWQIFAYGDETNVYMRGNYIAFTTCSATKPLIYGASDFRSGSSPFAGLTAKNLEITITQDSEEIYNLPQNPTQIGKTLNGYSKLPAGYTQVEYIANSGVSYIDTGYGITQTDSVTIEMDFQFLETSDGKWSGANGYLQHQYSYFNSQDRGIFVVDYNGSTFFETCYFNGTQTARQSWASFVRDSPLRIGIFRLGEAAAWWGDTSVIQNGKLWSYKLTFNNTLVRDCVPCLNEDGLYGLYDLVHQEFLVSQTTNFVGGDEKFVTTRDVFAGSSTQVNKNGFTPLPLGYTQVEYIQSSGNQYIDTGITFNSSNTIEFYTKIEYTRVDVRNQIMGFTGNYGSGIGTEQNSWWENPSTTEVKANMPYELYYYRSGAAWVRKANAITWQNGSGSLNITNNFMLFAAIGTVGSTTLSYYCYCKLYSAMIYQNNVLVRYFIPCKNSEGTYGLFDMVTQTFYGSNTSNAFSGGQVLKEYNSQNFNTNTSSHALPEGYIEVEYLSSGNSQYIDSGVQATSNISIEFKFALNALTSAEGYVFGADISPYFEVGTISGSFRIGNGTSSFVQLTQDTNDHVVSVSTTAAVFDGTTVMTGSNTFTQSHNYYMFASNNEGGVNYFCNCKVYYFKIYNSGVLIRDYVPCRNPDGIYGLYDLVGHQFYASQVSAQFIGGGTEIFAEKPYSYNFGNDSIVLPAGYTQVEYIRSNGASYIDTGWADANGIRSVYRAAYEEFAQPFYIVGSHNEGSPYGRNGGYWGGSRLGGAFELGYGEICPQVGHGSVNTIYDIDFKTTYDEAFLKVKGGDYEDWTTLITESGQHISAYNILIFYSQYTKNTSHAPPSKARLYYLLLFDSEENLVKYFIPCKNPSGEYGLYDIVNCEFFGSVTSTQFQGKEFETQAHIYANFSDSNITYDFEANRTFSSSQKHDTGVLLNYSNDFSIDMVVNAQEVGSRKLLIGNFDDGTLSFNLEVLANNTFRVYMGDYGVNEFSSGTLSANTDTTIHFEWDGQTGKWLFTATATNLNVSMSGTYTAFLGKSSTKTLVYGAADYRTSSPFSSITVKSCEITVSTNSSGTYMIPESTRLGYSLDGWSLLPTGYTQVEYVQTTGSAYIDTGIIPNHDTAVYVDFESTTFENSSCIVYGAGITYTERTYELYTWSNTFEFNYGYSCTFVGQTPTETKRVQTYQNRNDFYAMYDNTIYHDTVSWNYEFTTPYTMYVGSLNRGSAVGFTGSIRYYCVAIFQNNALIKYYVPCKNSSNVYGFYELVEGEFVSSSSSTNFTGGSATNITASMPSYGFLNQTLTASWAANELEFENQTLTKDFSVSSQTATISGAQNGTENYTYSIVSGNTSNYFSLSGTTLSLEASTPALTSYSLTLRVVDNETLQTKDAVLTLTVARAKLATKPTLSDSGSYTYTGSTISVNTNGYYETYMTRSGHTAQNVGDYTALYTLNSNYAWTDGSTENVSINWHITRKAISNLPTQKGTLTYNTKNQTPSWNNYVESELTIGGVYQNQKNAGTYNATFTPTANFKWSDGSIGAKTVSWTIEKAVVTTPTLTANLTFNLETQSPTLNYDNTLCEIVFGTTSEYHAGNYQVTIDLKDKNNYIYTDGTTSKTLDWSIARFNLGDAEIEIR